MDIFEKIDRIENKFVQFAVCFVLVAGIFAISFFVLQYILVEMSREMDPANPRAHLEKVLREFK